MPRANNHAIEISKLGGTMIAPFKYFYLLPPRKNLLDCASPYLPTYLYFVTYVKECLRTCFHNKISCTRKTPSNTLSEVGYLT